MNLLFDNINEKDKVAAIDDLIHDSTPRPSFFFLVVLSTIMATLGVIAENASVVIGSMLIAPILSPILSLSLGIVMSDSKIIKWSFVTLLKSTLYALACAIIFTFLFKNGYNTTLENTEIAARMDQTFLFLVIAIVAGLATAFARVKPDLNEALPGTAIAVALVPPLAVAGIGIGIWDWDMAIGAFKLYALNLIGIIIAAMFMFSLMNLYPKRRLAEAAQKKESKQLEKEKKKAKKAKKAEK